MISQNLMYLRKTKKVSLEELAEAIGVSRQAISKCIVVQLSRQKSDLFIMN